MTFGEKLRKLRKDADMTQEELAARLYVTRAAVSKWETDKGYPAIDSLKLIAELFGCTIDELVSDADVENQKKLESDRAKIMYVCAIACFAVAVAFALVAYFLSDMRWTIGAFVGIASYLVFAFFSRPRYKRLAGNGIYRAVVFILMLLVAAAVTIAGLVA